MSSSIVDIINYRCGSTCPNEILFCNTQTGIAVTSLASSVSILIVCIMKILSFRDILKNPVISNNLTKHLLHNDNVQY